MGDHVVQLARDSRPLLDDRLTRGDVALAFCEAHATLPAADHNPHEQHHDRRDDGEEDRAPEPRRVQRDRRARGREIEADERCEASRPRPHRDRVQVAHPAARRRGDLRGPGRLSDDRDRGGKNADHGRIASPDGDCDRDRRPEERDCDAVTLRRTCRPRLREQPHREHPGEDAVDGDEARARDVHARHARTAGSVCHRPIGRFGVTRKISRSAEPKIDGAADETSRRPT